MIKLQLRYEITEVDSDLTLLNLPSEVIEFLSDEDVVSSSETKSVFFMPLVVLERLEGTSLFKRHGTLDTLPKDVAQELIKRLELLYGKSQNFNTKTLDKAN